MAPEVDQAIIIILDVGSTSDRTGDESFYQKARVLTSRLIEKKIMCKDENLIGIILLGSKESDNSSAQFDDNFRHTKTYVPLQKPTWQMIRDLPEATSTWNGSWYDALKVADDYLKNRESGIKIINKKIILITSFQAPAHIESNGEIKQTLNNFKEKKYEVNIIGPDLYSEEDTKNFDIALARQFVESTNGATATFDNLLFLRKNRTKSRATNYDLCVGPNINIPVSAYLKIKNEPFIERWSKAVKDPITNTASTSEAIFKSKIYINTENQSVVPSSLVIQGYHYGQQCIPFADCDKNLLYQSGPKSLSVYGFTSYDNISWQTLNSDGLSYIFGRKNDDKAQKAIKCLVHCLSELNLVGIVRRVHNNGNAPKMYALIPVIDVKENLVCLSLIELCFKEDLKTMTLPPTNLKKYECNDKQVNAFKDLIEAMDLMKAYDDTEAFPIAQTENPTDQYILDCITYRAMNPGKPLPGPREEIKLLFQVPTLVSKRSKEALETIKELFTLNKIETTKRNNKPSNSNVDEDVKNGTLHNELNDNIPSIKNENLINRDNKPRVGTLDPIKDYEDLKIEGFSLKILSTQMSEAIQSMIINNIDGDFTKAFNAMKHFRKDCVKYDPTHYNDWLKTFKFQLTDLNKTDIVNMINAKGLNLILGSENSLSDVKSGEDSEMYEYDTAPMFTDININSEVNDIFDNM